MLFLSPPSSPTPLLPSADGMEHIASTEMTDPIDLLEPNIKDLKPKCKVFPVFINKSAHISQISIQ